MITGWALTAASREALLERFPPVYGLVLAHHVTHAARPKRGDKAPPPADIDVIGELIADGIQVLLVEVNGTSANPAFNGNPNHGGPTYHITWSIDGARGLRPKDANSAIRLAGPDNIPRFDPIRIDAFPVIF